jgi:hypothetical protein
MSMISAYCLVALYMVLMWGYGLESDECLRYIIKHGDMDIFVDLVPVDIHSKIACAAPVLGAFVVFFQDVGEVLNMFTASLFDAKVVNTECEGYWAKIVLP